MNCGRWGRTFARRDVFLGSSLLTEATCGWEKAQLLAGIWKLWFDPRPGKESTKKQTSIMSIWLHRPTHTHQAAGSLDRVGYWPSSTQEEVGKRSLVHCARTLERWLQGWWKNNPLRKLEADTRVISPESLGEGWDLVNDLRIYHLGLDKGFENVAWPNAYLPSGRWGGLKVSQKSCTATKSLVLGLFDGWEWASCSLEPLVGVGAEVFYLNNFQCK